MDATIITYHLCSIDKLFVLLDPNRILVSGQSLAATAVGKQSCFTLSNVVGAMEDIEIMIDAPSGDAVPADVTDTGNGAFRVDFTPQIAGEHQVCSRFYDLVRAHFPFTRLRGENCKLFRSQISGR